MTSSGRGDALARVALAGNPSDLYGGAVLAATVDAWSAQVLVAAADRPKIDPPSPLVEATARRFGAEFDAGVAPLAIRWRSSIPRTVGLGGSSALVIATTRALSEHCGLSFEPGELAEFALAVETKELGIVAGPQDRLAQAFEGLTYMDFSGGRGRCEPLEPTLLPPLLIAWQEEAGGASSQVHAKVRQPVNMAAVTGLAQSARQARTALRSGDLGAFAQAVDRSLDLRGELMDLDSPTLKMARVARGCGTAANYTGSGGAIVAVSGSPEQLRDAADELRGLGCAVLLAR